MNGALLRRALLALTLPSLVAACDRASAEPSPESTAADPAAPASAATPHADSARDALLARADLGRIKGNASAPVWVVVISDFQCPFCKRWHDETAPLIERNYVRTGKARIAYLNFPIASHRNAQPAHEFAMCAAEQSQFWPMADAIFASQDAWKRRSDAAVFFDSLARRLPIDHARLRSCVAAGGTRALITADYNRSVRIGIGSTPSFIIGEQAIVGAQPYEVFARAIDAALAAPRPAR